jgi:uncharacterized membrane protein
MKRVYLLMIIASALLVTAFSGTGGAAFETPSKYTKVELESGAANIGLTELKPGKVRHFQLGETGIKFFAYKGMDGVVITAFDTCKLCWSQKTGFSQRGEMMTCNSCGKESMITAIADFGHDCSPIVINHQIRNGNIHIEAGEFLAGAKYF